jgi:SMODS and SLOG-associating 2TM effector domain family 5
MGENAIERGNETAMRDYYKNYLNSIRMTSGCRFEASRRLKQKDIASSFTIAWLSLYPIILSVADLIPELKALEYSKYAAFIATVTSIMVLVLSLLEYSRQYSVRANQMLQCGQELNEIYYELDYLIVSGSIDEDSFRMIKSRYDKVIDKYPENHTQKDFHYYRATHVKKLKSTWDGRLYIVWHNSVHVVTQWGFYMVLLAIPPVIFNYIAGG